jgi:DtxR family Mn-dependent transcriptional regulator
MGGMDLSDHEPAPREDAGEAKLSVAVEDYVKAIHALEARGDGAVSTTALAERLDVTPGSVSTMVRKLSDSGLAVHKPYHGVSLTEDGRRRALEVIRHHRLLELYLAEKLDMPWDRVHDEAEVLEHYISEDLEERIAAALGEPEHDPHGDPIPGPDLELAEVTTRSLAELEVGESATFVRVSDSDPAMLRYLGERGIAPGDRLTVADVQPFGGPLSVRFGSGEHVLGGRLAQAMRVRTEEQGS